MVGQAVHCTPQGAEAGGGMGSPRGRRSCTALPSRPCTQPLFCSNPAPANKEGVHLKGPSRSHVTRRSSRCKRTMRTRSLGCVPCRAVWPCVKVWPHRPCRAPTPARAALKEPINNFVFPKLERVFSDIVSFAASDFRASVPCVRPIEPPESSPRARRDGAGDANAAVFQSPQRRPPKGKSFVLFALLSAHETLLGGKEGWRNGQRQERCFLLPCWGGTVCPLRRGGEGKRRQEAWCQLNKGILRNVFGPRNFWLCLRSATGREHQSAMDLIWSSRKG